MDSLENLQEDSISNFKKIVAAEWNRTFDHLLEGNAVSFELNFHDMLNSNLPHALVAAIF